MVTSTVEAYASHFLYEHKVNKLPLDAEKIARRKGIELSSYSHAKDFLERFDLGYCLEKYACFSAVINKVIYIFYSDDFTYDERRINIAHELGHIEMHSDYMVDGVIGKSEDPEEEAQMEDEAIAFSHMVIAPVFLLYKMKAQDAFEIEKLTGMSHAWCIEAHRRMFNYVQCLGQLKVESKVTKKFRSIFMARFIERNSFAIVIVLFSLLVSVIVCFILFYNSVASCRDIVYM